MSDKPPIDFSKDASTFEEMSQEKLNTLAILAQEARKLEGDIEFDEAALKTKKERFNLIVEKLIPDVMIEMSITEIKLITGEKLIMKKFYGASIKDEFQERAFAWLREHGHDSLIKNKIEASFGKGEDAKIAELMKILAPLGATCKTSVHPMTLKSFVKEQIESGQEIPADLFGLHIGNKITIK